jgi:hypothetical protein
MRMAETDSGAMPWAARRRQVSRQESPQSMSRRVVEDARSELLPRLPEARTVIETATRDRIAGKCEVSKRQAKGVAKSATRLDRALEKNRGERNWSKISGLEARYVQ